MLRVGWGRVRRRRCVGGRLTGGCARSGSMARCMWRWLMCWRLMRWWRVGGLDAPTGERVLDVWCVALVTSVPAGELCPRPCWKALALGGAGAASLMGVGSWRVCARRRGACSVCAGSSSRTGGCSTLTRRRGTSRCAGCVVRGSTMTRRRGRRRSRTSSTTSCRSRSARTCRRIRATSLTLTVGATHSGRTRCRPAVWGTWSRRGGDCAEVGSPRRENPGRPRAAHYPPGRFLSPRV